MSTLIAPLLVCSVVGDTLPSDSTRYLIVIIFSFLKWYILLVRINAHNNNNRHHTPALQGCLVEIEVQSFQETIQTLLQ